MAKADVRLRIYQTLRDHAHIAYTVTLAPAADAKRAVEDHALRRAAAAEVVTAAITRCKGLGYDVAQKNAKEIFAKAEADAKTAAEVKANYAPFHKEHAPGTRGARCYYVPSENWRVPDARPACNPGLCCGSAHKLLLELGPAGGW